MSRLIQLTIALAALPSLAAAQDALQIDGDTCTLTVHELLALQGPTDLFVQTPDGGFILNGDVTLVTPWAEFPLPEAYLSVRPMEVDGPLDFEVLGSVRPDLTSLPGVGQYFSSGPVAYFGVTTRDVLQNALGGELPLPENPSPADPSVLLEPAYVFFHFDSGLEMDLPLDEVLGIDPAALAGDLGYSLPEVAVTVVFDPTDPFFYFATQAAPGEDEEVEEEESTLDKLLGKIEDKLLEKAESELEDALEEALEEESTNDSSDDSTSDSNESTDDLEDAVNDAIEDAVTDALEDDSSESEDDTENAEEDEDDGMTYELTAVAFSWLGGIPFAPETTWGLPEGTGELHGNVLVEGAVSIYGVKIDGQVVAGAGLDGVELGANADVEVGFEAGPFGITVPLGQASLAMKVAPYDIEMAFSGLLDIGGISLETGSDVIDGFLPEEIPLSLTGQAMAAGYLHTNGLGWFDAGLSAQGDFQMAPYGFETWSLDVSGALELSSSGLSMSGALVGNLHPALQFEGEVGVAADFPFDNPTSWSIGVWGELTVGGVNLGSAHVLINELGVFVDGAYNTPITQIQLVGELTANGPYLAGFASINMGEQGVGQVFLAAEQAVANAQAGLASIDEEMAAMIAYIEAERAVAQAGIDIAQEVVDAASSVVASLQSSINYHYSMISTRQGQINWWYNWAKSQHWTKSAWAWGVYAVESGWRNAEIASRYGSIAALQVSTAAANAALSVAETALQTAESALAAFPIELDARVVAIQVFRDAALVVLQVADAALAAIPPLPDNLIAEISFELDAHGMNGAASITLDSNELVGGDVTIGQYVELSIFVPVIGEVSITL